METLPEISPGTTSVHVRLLQRFYCDGSAIHDKSASSHWRDYATRFSVRSEGDAIELLGCGFGGSDKSTFIARFFALVGNMLHLATLGLPNLRSNVRDAKVVVKRIGLTFSQDAFRQVCTLNLLERYLEPKAPDRILVIGDGHGILSALLHARYPSAQIFLADLGAVLFFSGLPSAKGLSRCIASTDG